jgi:hypothetical protein
VSETVVESDGDSDGEDDGDDDDDVDVDGVPPVLKMPDGRVAAAVGEDVVVVVVVEVVVLVVVVELLIVDGVGDSTGKNIPRRRLARLVDPRVLLYTLC